MPRRVRCAVALLSIVAAPVLAQTPAPASPRLGRPITAAAAVQADPAVFPDGRGLPAGRGTAIDGRRVYDRRCASCHGADGSGGNSVRLVGRAPLTASPWPDKTVGQYWPFATTVFDYVRRAMPFERPGSLTDDEVYAVTAYLLFANGIVAERDEMSASTLPAVRMPNREGFIRLDRTSAAIGP
ncbi:c-type cytochrome [Methylibium sp.]|uniref:c-type cytochrome n=1 Tax=Methylibium sp. TaxID=2067992 RepID=UPI003D143A5D